MISLQQHIAEKLIINKNFKKETSTPNDEGICLRLWITSPTIRQKQRISLYTGHYLYDNIHDSITLTSLNDKSERNEKGYFQSSPNKFWDVIILFNEEAIDFLDMLSKDPEQIIDVSKYIVDAKTYKYIKYQCIPDAGNFYNKQDFDSMKKRIK